jgi:hypothetical protein
MQSDGKTDRPQVGFEEVILPEISLDHLMTTYNNTHTETAAGGQNASKLAEAKKSLLRPLCGLDLKQELGPYLRDPNDDEPSSSLTCWINIRGARMFEERRLRFVVTLVVLFSCLGCSPQMISGYQIVKQRGGLSKQEQKTLTATCPAGKKVLGGGVGGNDPALNIFESRPLDDGTGWQATAKSEWWLPSSIGFDVYAICADSQ